MADKKKTKKVATKAKKKAAKVKKKAKLGIDPLGNVNAKSLSNKSGQVHGLDRDHASGIDSLIRDTSDDAELVPATPEAIAQETPKAEEKPAPKKEPLALEITEAIAATPPAMEEEIIPAKPETVQKKIVDIDLDKEVEEEPPIDEDTQETPVVDEPTPVIADDSKEVEPSEKKAAQQAHDKPAVNKETPAEKKSAIKEAASPYRIMDDDEAGMTKFFSFMLGEERFALPIDNVKEVLQYSKPTPVPRTPPYMMGVHNLRGSVVPVVDLRLFLGIKVSEVTVHTSIVIVEMEIEGDEGKIGAIIDSVSEVLEIKNTDITEIPKVDSSVSAEYITGMGKVIGKKSGKEEFVLILSVENVFSVESLTKE